MFNRYTIDYFSFGQITTILKMVSFDEVDRIEIEPALPEMIKSHLEVDWEDVEWWLPRPVTGL